MLTVVALAMPTVHRFEELEIWKMARALFKAVYLITERQPFRTCLRLRDQMRSSTGSIADNIAEGFDRGSRLEFVHALYIAKGESGELKSQLHRCFDVELISAIEYRQLYGSADLLAKKINNFAFYLNRSSIKGQQFKDRK